MMKYPHKCAAHDQFGVNESFISVQSLLVFLPVPAAGGNLHNRFLHVVWINVQMIP